MPGAGDSAHGLGSAARPRLGNQATADAAMRRSRLLADTPVDAIELAALAETEALERVLELLRRELGVC
ncbi:MAG: hypothetical protein JWQ90_4992 [Hydrocarboniphaga sp.]|nr:hypothetical protein [Hydrocarboniphaga sp.]